MRKVFAEQGGGGGAVAGENAPAVRDASVLASTKRPVKLMTLSGKDLAEIVRGDLPAFEGLKKTLEDAHNTREIRTVAMKMWKRSEAHERLKASRATKVGGGGRSLFDD